MYVVTNEMDKIAETLVSSYLTRSDPKLQTIFLN